MEFLFTVLGLILFSFVFKQIQVLSGPVYSKVEENNNEVS